jgi:hypothetical protein
MTPLGAVVRGLAAGVAGTAAMDFLWYQRYKRGGGESGFLKWEFSSEVCTWEDAPAPALVGKRLVEGFLQQELPAERAALVNNIVHWTYGISWGSLYGIVAGTIGPRRIYLGLLYGAGVWTSSYVLLPLARLYKPIWEYDLKTLGKDLSAHLVYGLGTSATFAGLSMTTFVPGERGSQHPEELSEALGLSPAR